MKLKKMIRSTPVLATISLFLTLMAIAQNPAATAGAASSTTTLTSHDDGRIITLAKGATLVVQLESNPTTGYSWAVKGNTAPLKLVGSDSKPTDQSGRMGAPSTQQFRFKAMETGTVTLKLIYRRPWEQNIAPVKTFAAIVRVN